MVKQYMERRQGSSDPKYRSVEDKPLSCAASLLSTIRKFKTFNGTASRREFAWWLSANLVMALILRTAGHHQPEILYAGSIWSIGIMLPTLAVGSRRLHDAGHRGIWTILLYLGNIAALVIGLCYKIADPASVSFSPNVFPSVINVNLQLSAPYTSWVGLFTILCQVIYVVLMVQNPRVTSRPNTAIATTTEA